MKERAFPVPESIRGALLGNTATMSVIDRVVSSGAGTSAEREWAIGMRDRFVSRMVSRVADESELPRGIIASVDDADVVIGLIMSDGRVWSGEWLEAGELQPGDVIDLTMEEVAFTVDAISAGACGLALCAAMPVATLTAAETSAPASAPAGAKMVAILDDVDRQAVLELVAIAPGPHVFRRHAGKWEKDDGWLRKLRSVKPPPVQELSGELAASVIEQVDAATANDEFEPVTASGTEWDDRLSEMKMEWALVAAGKVSNKVRGKAYDVAGVMPPHLQKYWTVGRGAAKIRWGTPGAWRRCHRQLSKYMGPFMAKGACTNLGQKLGGKGVAWDVGGRAKRAAKRAAS